MRSESTSALGQPRLTKPMRGAVCANVEGWAMGREGTGKRARILAPACRRGKAGRLYTSVDQLIGQGRHAIDLAQGRQQGRVVQGHGAVLPAVVPEVPP